MVFLLDTSVVIDHFQSLRGEASTLLSEYADKELRISSVTIAELFHGAYKSRHPAKNIRELKEFLRLPHMDVVTFGAEQALEYGRLMANLEKKGQVIGSLDVMIAATAHCHKLVILSRDKRHFARLKDFGIKIKIIN